MGNSLPKVQEEAADSLELTIQDHPVTLTRDQLKDLLPWVHEQFPQAEPSSLFNPFFGDSVSPRLYNAATLKNSAAAKLFPACRVVYEAVANKSNAQNHADDRSENQTEKPNAPKAKKADKVERGWASPASPPFQTSSAAAAGPKGSLAANQPDVRAIPIAEGQAHPGGRRGMFPTYKLPSGLRGRSPGIGGIRHADKPVSTEMSQAVPAAPSVSAQMVRDRQTAQLT